MVDLTENTKEILHGLLTKYTVYKLQSLVQCFAMKAWSSVTRQRKISAIFSQKNLYKI